MKKWKLPVCVLLAICLFGGCALVEDSGLLSDSYVSVQEHKDPYAAKESSDATEPTEESEDALPAVGNYYEMMGILRSFVTDGVEHGRFLLENYRGDREEELVEAFYAITEEDPLGAYAIDYIEYEHTALGSAWLVTVDAVYRRSSSEIQSIRSVRGNERAMSYITDTLNQLGSSVTLRVSGYAEEDLTARLRSYCLEHPNIIVQMPEISVAVYPNSGNVRVLELHFTYHTDRESLRNMQSESESVLVSAERYAHYAPDEAAKVALIYSYLTSRFSYTEDEAEGSVYRLLCEGVGNSESFAAVTAYLCQRVGVQCQLVEGTRMAAAETEEPDEAEPQPYVWNIVKIDGVYYHLDFQQDALEGLEECRLLLDSQMTGYEWDRELYPVCNGEAEEASEE